MHENPDTVIAQAVNTLHLRSEIAFDAAERVNRPDFVEQGQNFLALALLVERLRN